MQVSINVLTWNDRRYLADFFASLEAQTYRDLVVRVLDNGSSDGTLEYLQQHHSQFLIARHTRHQGFASGHNQLLKFALERWRGQDLRQKAVLMVSAASLLDPKLLEELVTALSADPALGAVQPKVLRAFANVTTDDGLEHNLYSDVLETTGLRDASLWGMGERGVGEVDKGQYDQAPEVAGPSGVLALYRAQALADVIHDGDIFDRALPAPQASHDLAVRLRRAGAKTRFVPGAKAHYYHGQQAQGREGSGVAEKLLFWLKRRKG